MAADPDVVGAFLAGAAVVGDAVGSAVVGAQWDAPSVLEQQTVGMLAGHLARAGVGIVGECLELPVPDGPLTFDSAGHYYASAVESAGTERHRALRERSAAIAALGPAGVGTLRASCEQLATALRTAAPDRHIAVIGGPVMRLADYLASRVVEQAVHLDDLARSVDGAQWHVPDACTRIAIAVGIDIGQRRAGPTAVMRALYRDGFAGCFPVL